MKLTQKSSNKKYVIIAAILLCAIVTLVAVAYQSKSWPFSQDQSTSKNQESDMNEAKSDSVSSNSSKPDTDKDTAEENTPINKPGPSPTLTVSDFRQSNGIVYATTQITQSSNSGSCVFTYTAKDSKPVVQEVVSTNTQCVSSIPEVQFDKVGNWNLKVSFNAQNTKLEVSKDVTIK